MTVAIEQLYRLLSRFEQGPEGGPALTAYLCPAGKWTIAFGCTKDRHGNPISEGDTITEAQVYPYTEAAVERVLADVKRIVKRPLNEYQYAALCSFVFNLGGGNLAASTKLLPAIEAGRWEDAAESLGEFVRAWGKKDGHHFRMALFGLRIRRYAEGCLLLGLDWEDACSEEHIAMPKRKPPEWQPDWVDPDGIRTGGRYFDVLLPGATPFHMIQELAEATPLPALDLILQSPAPASNPSGNGAGTQKPPSPSVVPVPQVSPPVMGPTAKPVETTTPSQAPSRPGTLPPVLRPAPAGAPIVYKPEGTAPVVVKPPVQLPAPLPPPHDPLPTDLVNPKDMILSRRFWGLAVTAIGTTHLIPADWSKWLANETTRELVSWIAVVLVGVIIYQIGKKKATRPLK